MKITKCKLNVKGFYYYCARCCRQIEFYEYMNYSGLCSNCFYCN